MYRKYYCLYVQIHSTSGYGVSPDDAAQKTFCCHSEIFVLSCHRVTVHLPQAILSGVSVGGADLKGKEKKIYVSHVNMEYEIL